MAAPSGQFLHSILSFPDSTHGINRGLVFEGQHNLSTDSPHHLNKMKPINILKEELLPTVLPCINDLLTMIKDDKEYEREKLNSVNWMVEYLYRNNPRYKAQRQSMELLDIPFVQKILAKRPQPPLPLHLRLTKNEAATLIQAGVRGYMARQLKCVQGFRDKLRKKQVAATVIQSAWRAHKVRQTITDEDLCSKDYCNLYYNSKTPDKTEGDDIEDAAES